MTYGMVPDCTGMIVLFMPTGCVSCTYIQRAFDLPVHACNMQICYFPFESVIIDDRCVKCAGMIILIMPTNLLSCPRMQ